MKDRGTSPYSELIGFETLEWGQGFARVACEATPAVLNRNGIVHGGVLLALLDEAGGAAGLWSPVSGEERRSVTVDLSCSFVSPGQPGRIVAEARVVGGGRSIYFTRSEARDESGRLLAFAASTHRYRGEGGRAKPT